MTPRSTQRTAVRQAPTDKGERAFNRIREAALELFSRLGFERATMADIARSANVSQPALHYHFQDKGELWRSAMGLLTDAIVDEERMIAAARDAPAITRLQIVMRHFVHLSCRRPALGRIVALEGMAGGERLDWLIHKVIGARNRELVALIEEAIAAGDLKPFAPEQILILLQAGAAGASNLAPLMRANFGFDPDRPGVQEAYEDLVVETMISGLGSNKKPGSE